MALTKSAETTLWSTTNLAVGTPQSTSAIQTYYGTTIVGNITNGGTGPSLPAVIRFDFSNDGSTNWRQGPTVVVGDTANSAVTYFTLSLGIGAGADYPYVRLTASGNTGQAVSLNAWAETTTAL